MAESKESRGISGVGGVWGVGEVGFKASMHSAAPMGGLSERDQKRFYGWLSEQDRRYLRKAYDYYNDLMKRLGEMNK